MRKGTAMSGSRSSFERIVERERGLRRGLSAARLGMIAIGGAIGTGLFLGSGFAISLAGPSVLISYAIGAVIALLLMGSLAEMTVAHPTTGSFGAYAEHYLSPLLGFLVRYAYWAANVLAVGTEVTAVALYMHYWFPAVSGGWWIVGFSLLLIGVNARAVDVFGAVEYWFSAVKIAGILMFIALASFLLWHASAQAPIGWHNYLRQGGLFPKGVWGTWVAVIMAIFSYLSIEMIAVAAGEAAEPELAVTRAFRATLLRLVLFYLVTLALMLAIVPWNLAGVDESPFVKVMRLLRLPYAAGVVNFVVLVAALSAMNSQLYITTRMMFSLSRAGAAPSRFGTLSKRGVPVQALMLSSIGIAVAVSFVVLAPQSAFILMVSISGFGSMFAWLIIFVTHLAFRRARALEQAPPLRFRMPGFPFTSVLGAALMAAVLITTAFTEAFRTTLLFGVPFLLVLALMYRIWYRRAAAGAPSSSATGASLDARRPN
jgi:amino acid transporter, AAT family